MGDVANLPMVLPKQKSLEERLAEAEYREEAVRTVLRALIVSMRPYGFNKARFKRIVSEVGEETSNEGPEAVMHEVLNRERRRVLRETS